LAQNPKGLAHSLTEKLQFAAKIDRNSVFLGRKAQILNRLQIIVPYISFYEFKIFQILAQNAKVQFYRKRQFTVKTDRNSVFLGQNTQIPDRLHIMLP
jgi:hypothetical protein